MELRECVGAENFFLFGLTIEQLEERRKRGYDPRAVVAGDHELAAVLGEIDEGTFSPPGDPGLFRPLVRELVERDPFFVLADFRAFVQASEEAVWLPNALVARAWSDPAGWTRASILNTARSGYFSSDRAIHEYAAKVWHVGPAPIAVPAPRK